MLFRPLFAVVGLSVLAGFCGELPANLAPADIPRAQLLGDQIANLGPKVRPDEAQRVAECAYATAQRLRLNYGTLWPPSLNNVLVNTGFRKRGLCFQWAEDLLAQLDALKATTIELHWADAYAGTWREHNVVVVTAKGQPFRDGILLDCWRHAGHLFCSRVATDNYPWVENSSYAGIVRSKFEPIRKSLIEEQSRSISNQRSPITAATR